MFVKASSRKPWRSTLSIADALDALLPAGAPWNGTAPEAAGSAEDGSEGARVNTQPASTPLPLPRDELHALCQKLRVTRLRLFGSAVRDDFGPESDIDLLVEY